MATAGKKINWIAWILLFAGIAAALYFFVFKKKKKKSIILVHSPETIPTPTTETTVGTTNVPNVIISTFKAPAGQNPETAINNIKAMPQPVKELYNPIFTKPPLKAFLNNASETFTKLIN